MTAGRLLRSILLGWLFSGPGAAFAAEWFDCADSAAPVAPGEFQDATCNAVCEYGYNYGYMGFCDLSVNGESTGAEAWYVTDYEGAGSSHTWTVFGTDGSGGPFCCAITDSERLFYFEIIGAVEDDSISAVYAPEGVEFSQCDWAVAMGGDGSDVLTGSNATTSENLGFEELYGGGGPDELNGNSGCECLYGNAGADALWGHAGSDGLFGGTGADNLYGGIGADVLSGGGGADYMLDVSGSNLLYSPVGSSPTGSAGAGSRCGHPLLGQRAGALCTYDLASAPDCSSC